MIQTGAKYSRQGFQVGLLVFGVVKRKSSKWNSERLRGTFSI